MYFKNGKVKVELALAKGKQLWDKRETERRRTADKEAREASREVAQELAMTARLREWFRNPLFLLALTAGLSAFVVQSGELGTADTMHRLQTAHSFWTSEPSVFPDEYPEFGVHGRGGKLYDWYGIGQPLLMLPTDVVGTYIETLASLRELQRQRPERAQHRGQLQHQHSGERSDSADLFSLSAAC